MNTTTRIQLSPVDGVRYDGPSGSCIVRQVRGFSWIIQNGTVTELRSQVEAHRLAAERVA